MVKRPLGSVNRKSAGGDKALALAEWLRFGQERLRAAGLDSPRREAEELLACALKLPRARIVAERTQLLPARQARAFRALLARRGRRQPLQYLTGEEDFAGLKLRVGPGVLIPRPETELLVAEAARLSPPAATRLAADLGTGSGCVALALALRFPSARIYATELSPRALRYARNNRRRSRLRRVRMLQGRAGNPIPRRLWGKFDLVVSNPPYISRDDLPDLQPEVRHEPRLALDGGPDGLESINEMAAAAAQLLRPQGLFICEMGIGQEQKVREIFGKAGFIEIQVKRDWQEIPRIIAGRLGK
jgi:release factor glutamine methyltransferase